jgi:hypothetical protein
LGHVTWSLEPAAVWRGAPGAPGAAGAGAQTREAGFFYKVVDAGAYGPEYFSRAHAAYARLAAARAATRSAGLGGATAPPAALVDAELLYGAARICVLMPFIDGRDATPEELGEGGSAVAPVVEALLWLARQRILYHDVRPPNVRIQADGRVRLLDYDDAIVVKAPPASFAAHAEALQELVVAAFPGVDGTFLSPSPHPRALPFVAAALAEAWATALQ